MNNDLRLKKLSREGNLYWLAFAPRPLEWLRCSYSSFSVMASDSDLSPIYGLAWMRIQVAPEVASLIADAAFSLVLTSPDCVFFVLHYFVDDQIRTSTYSVSDESW